MWIERHRVRVADERKFHFGHFRPFSTYDGYEVDLVDSIVIEVTKTTSVEAEYTTNAFKMNDDRCVCDCRYRIDRDEIGKCLFKIHGRGLASFLCATSVLSVPQWIRLLSQTTTETLGTQSLYRGSNSKLASSIVLVDRRSPL